ncbi:MAG: SRPBCC domain-containing protein [Gemmatimonadota bacterium]
MRSVWILAGLVAATAAGSRVAGAAERRQQEKMLRIEITVPAARSEVWKAFSTSEGLSTWLAPNAVVDLRPGGEWMVHFAGSSSAGGNIVSFVPKKQIVIAAMAPEQFPTVRAQRTSAKFELEDRGKETLVRLTQTGWKDGDEWDRAYEYLTAGNAQLLAALHKRFVSGPLDFAEKGESQK